MYEYLLKRLSSMSVNDLERWADEIGIACMNGSDPATCVFYIREINAEIEKRG